MNNNNSLQILVKIKQVYGNKTIYPICDSGKLLLELTGKKTFTEKDILAIKKLGYTFNVKQDTL